MGQVSKEIPDLASFPSALAWAKEMVARGLAAGPVLVTLGRPKRSLDQNAMLWSLLTDIARDVIWFGQRLTPEEWKDVLTAGLKKQRVVPGTDGGFVVIGAHTSTMNKEEFSELIELVLAFGAQHGVGWTNEAQPDR